MHKFKKIKKHYNYFHKYKIKNFMFFYLNKMFLKIPQKFLL